MGSRDSLGKTLGSVLLTLLLTLSVAAVEHNITLSLPPVVVHGPRPHVLYNAGKTEYLRCLATGAQPLEYDWYRNGQLLSYNDSSYERRADQPGTLIVRTRTGMTDGYYQCKAANDAGVAISNITFLQEAVLQRKGRRDVNKLEVTEGDRLTLQCDHIRSVPADSLTYTWHSAPGIKQPTSGYIQQSERVSIDFKGRLVFSNVLPEDSLDGSIYKCKASNPHKREQKFGSYYKITVTKRAHSHGVVPKLIYHSPTPSVALEGETVTLQCFFSGIPTPNVEWELPDGVDKGRLSPTSFSRELRIEQVRAEDAGKYRCHGRNSAGRSEEASIYLQVQASPRWLHRPVSQNVTEGGQVSFRCEAEGTPAPSITWYRNDQPLNNFTFNEWLLGDNGHLLTIRDVTLADTSTIHCNVSNQHGYLLTGAYLSVTPQIYVTTEESSEKPVTSPAGFTDANNTTSIVSATTPTTTPEMTTAAQTSTAVSHVTVDDESSSKEVINSVMEGIKISPDKKSASKSGVNLGYIVFPPVLILALILLILVIFMVRRKRKQKRSYSVNGREKRHGIMRWRKRDYDSDDSGYNGEDERPMRSRVQVIDITEVEPSASDQLDPTPVRC